MVDEATFPTTTTRVKRARDWIGRRTDGDIDGVLVAAEGTGSYGAVLAEVLEETGYRVVEAQIRGVNAVGGRPTHWTPCSQPAPRW